MRTLSLPLIALFPTAAFAGAGTIPFAPAVDHEISGSQPKDMVAADFDGDGHLDLAITAYDCGGDDAVTLLFGDGDGGFLDNATFGGFSCPWGIGVGDFDGDGNPDLALTEGGGEHTGVRVFLGDGNGAFTLSAALTAGTFPIGVVSGDFDEDGDDDLAVANNVVYGATVFLGDGAGHFPSAQHVPGIAGFHATDIAVGHFNDDAHLDLALAHYGGVTILSGAGDGTFALSVGAGVNEITDAVAAGDLDGDGQTDVASALLYSGNAVARFRGAGGSFSAPIYFAVGSFERDVAIADLDGDGNADLIGVHQDGHALALFAGLGGGAFGARQTLATGTQPEAVVVVDLNEDGAPDLATANRNYGDTAYVSVLLQLPPPPPVPGDLDGDGDVDFGDLLALLGAWGPCPAPPALCPADVNGSGAVDFADLLALLGNWS